ncbi:MAG: TolB family protein [Chloroflexota bacterium]
MSTTQTRPSQKKPGRAGATRRRKSTEKDTGRRRVSGHAPRPLLIATTCAFFVAVGILAWDLTASWRIAPPGVAGQIAMPASGGVTLINTENGRTSELVSSQGNASVTSVAWSPDRQTLAYTLFHRRPEDRVSSAELFSIPQAGGEPTLLVPRPQPGTVIDSPAWAPDASAIFYAFQGVENNRPVARIEQVELGTGNRRPLYENASFPTVSPDGQQLAFTFDDGKGQALRIGPVAGGEAREIIKPTAFRSLMGPRFSPDGNWIAFVAVGPGPSGARPQQPPGLADLLGVSVAYAHGDPYGVWKVRPDGSDLQTATPLLEDEPLLSWSKDGAWLAVHGTGGLWIVDVSGATEPRRIADGTIGGIDW